MKVKKLKRIPKSLLRLLLKLLSVLLITYILLHFIFGLFIMHGNQMFPAVRDGDLVLTYRLDEYLTNDIVVYKYNNDVHFGRIVAKEDDSVDISDIGELLINGTRPSEQIYYATYQAEEALVEYPYTVPEKSLFILSDFRDGFEDSRQYEAIPRSEVQGKVIFLLRRRGF